MTTAMCWYCGRKPVRAKGLCHACYARRRRNGTLERIRRPRAVTREAFHTDPTDPRHGTPNGYINLRCRCERCRRANAVKQFEYYVRHPEQRDKNRQHTQEQRAQRAGFATRAEFDAATRIYRCPADGCTWNAKVFPAWLARGLDGGFRLHWKRNHFEVPEPIIEEAN